MIKKYYSQIKDSSIILPKLVKLFGAPTITRKLSIYAYNEGDEEAQVNFIDRDCFLSFYLNDFRDTTQNLRIKNTNIKYLFKSIYALGFKQANISEIIQLVYKVNGKTKIILSFNTYIGNVITVETDNIASIEDQLDIKLNPRENLDTQIEEKHQLLKSKRSPIFNDLNVLNSDITKYANSVGVDIRSVNQSIAARIESFSNDYSIYESPYKQVTGAELLARQSHNNKDLFSPVSIVIPCYNVDTTLLKCLYSIQHQALEKSQLSKIEVNLIDDCSRNLVKDLINGHSFDFKLNIIRLEENKGISIARNIGFGVSKHEQILFMDADIILPVNYILEVSTRLKMISGAVFVTFKKNIKDLDIELEQIQKGINPPNHFDDLRIHRLVTSGTAGVRPIKLDSHTEMLADSNYFKDLGYGRVIGNFDLPSMLIGHNFSLNKKIIKENNFFSKDFKGWGFEDTYLGACVVAHGNFIIPVLSTGVYHIEHPPRSGSEEQKMHELRSNLEVYKRKLNETAKSDEE